MNARRRVLYGVLFVVAAFAVRVGMDLIYNDPGGALMEEAEQTVQ